MRFIHTADWQIGKVFKQFGEKEPLLRQARLNAIESIGKLAHGQGIRHVFVAGDIYDTEAPAPKTLLEPLERMRQCAEVDWYLIPGNHDPHRPKGIWDRASGSGLPPNVHLCLMPRPMPVGPGAVLLPAPLTRKSEAKDLTEWMDAAASPPGTVRIGLAHGSVTGFGTEGEANNPIDPRRLQSAGLDYLGLGDWHRTARIAPAVWYAGTPEPDRMASQEEGQVLLVEIAGCGAPAAVASHRVGTYRWFAKTEEVIEAAELDGIESRLRALPDLSRCVMRLNLKGALPLGTHAQLDHRLQGLAAALFHLDADLSALGVRPAAADLEAIDFDGVLRRAAERLLDMTRDEARDPAQRKRAEAALVQLFVMVNPKAKGARQ